MNVDEAIYSRLSGFSQLSDLVGTRISPNTKEQDSVLPAITYEKISAQRFSAMSVDSGVVKARYQFDVWAASKEKALAVREALRQALQRWNTTTGITIWDVFFITEFDLYEDETKQYHIAMDFEINYKET